MTKDMKQRYRPLNCSKCGRFVGEDGFQDVFYDGYNGGWEIGYPLCKRCLDEINAKQKERRGR